jgi:sporulation protein YlmC with PRC-barrel domain
MRSVLGQAVKDENGKDAGHIKEVIFEAITGNLTYTVLTLGGFVGLGEKLFMVPWYMLQQPISNDTFRLAMTAEELKDAPSFNADKWPDMEDRHWTDAVHVYYGNVSALGKHLPPKTAGDERGGFVPHRFLRASAVLQGSIANARGQLLGDIKDMVLDTAAGKVTYAVLGFGGVIGLGEKLFAIPWPELQESRGLGTFTLDVDKKVLQEAPGFDKNHWPQTAESLKK